MMSLEPSPIGVGMSICTPTGFTLNPFPFYISFENGRLVELILLIDTSPILSTSVLRPYLS
ncbi:MAG: hypothetical protein VZQ98_11330 [Bacteroidales bacterium]|nr:hypothetical protein [Bacteroidales bacterium]